MVHLSHIYSLDSNQNFLPNPLYTRLFNFHKKKQNQNTPVNMISPCMDLCLDNLICMKQNKIKPTLNVKKSLLHHTPVKLFASCTNGCTSHLISTEQKKIKTLYGAFKFHLFKGFESTYFCIHWMHVNVYNSSHYCQSDSTCTNGCVDYL